MTTKLIIPWDTSQLEPLTEWNLWRQLRGAYGINDIVMLPRLDETARLAYTHVDTMEEALSLAIGERIFLDASGLNDISQIPRDGDATIIVGNTNLPLSQYAHSEDCYRIPSPGRSDLYGVNAAAIALSIRYSQ